MPRIKQKKREDEELSSPAWMTTFGDMMMLLLTFFVLLYSMSVIDVAKFQDVMSALSAQLGVLDGGKTISSQTFVDKGSMGENFNVTPRKSLKAIMGEMNQYVEEKGLEDKVTLRLTQRGLIVSFTGQVLYDVGKADIKAGGKEVLDKIAGMLKDIPNTVMVEGHTDNWPISNDEFPSNWELSTTRATNVIKYFIESNKIDPARLSAAGYGEYRPLYQNDSDVHRAKNRRVEVVIMNLIYARNRERGNTGG